MKYTQSEKMEIIRMVEDSSLSVKKTLEEIGVSRSTFYEWYKRYQEQVRSAADITHIFLRVGIFRPYH